MNKYYVYLDDAVIEDPIVNANDKDEVEQHCIDTYGIKPESIELIESDI